MIEKAAEINKFFSQLPAIKLKESFIAEGMLLAGYIEVFESEISLEFKVEILPHYPFQFHNSETIRFINPELNIYDHVNGDGSICVHTLHSPDLETKIALDINSLRHWIKKYYISNEGDKHYEHIITPQNGMNGEHSFFLFTEVDHTFKSGDFGNFEYSTLSYGSYKSEKATTNIVQGFWVNKTLKLCSWSRNYHNLAKNKGVYYFGADAPVFTKRFAAISWQMLENYFSQPFLNYLYSLQRQFNTPKLKGSVLPIMIGYPISTSEIHWQVALIQVDQFPNYGEKVKGSTTYIGKMHNQIINWGQTKNSSYHYFFGRGLLHPKFSKSKILIIGLGAVGSMVATTLVRGGCTHLGLIDYDIKEPENVCRSEYPFNTGINNKVDDLGNILVNISPFVDIQINEGLFDWAKVIVQVEGSQKEIEDRLNKYDIIFDCSTDNDVAFILSKLNITGSIFNFSLTNYATNLVCATKSDLYDWLITIFSKLENNLEDLYEPLGCWSPTFKAGFNDIAAMVQFAIKHINAEYIKGRAERNFYLTYSNTDQTNIQLTQF